MSVSVGYGDWNQITTFDGDLDAYTLAVAQAGPFGPYNCQNWASIGFDVVGAGANPFSFIASYWADEALTQGLGGRTALIDGAQVGSATGFYPNLGPWVRVAISNLTGVGIPAGLALWRSNRLVARDYVAPSFPFVNAGTPSIAAGATTNTFGTTVIPGPVEYHWATNTQAGTLTIQALNAVGGYSTLKIVTMAATSSGNGTIILPEATTRWQLTNNGASASTFNVLAWPSLSGSS